MREYLEKDALFEGVRQRNMIDMLVKNAKITTKEWLYYDPPEYKGNVLYFRAGKRPIGAQGAVAMMYDSILQESASGFEKLIPKDKLKIVPIYEEHDGLMSDKALDIIVPELRSFLTEISVQQENGRQRKDQHDNDNR